MEIERDLVECRVFCCLLYFVSLLHSVLVNSCGKVESELQDRLQGPLGRTKHCLASYQISLSALARRLRGLERKPVHQRAAGSIPGQGAYGRQPLDVSFSLSFFSHLLPSPLSVKPINII